MAHPSKNLPKNLYYLKDANAVTAPEGKHFFSVTSLDGGTIQVKGGGIFEYLAADAGTDTHLDTDGSVLGAEHDAGYYEAISSQAVSIELSAGQTVFGRFTYAEGAASKEFLVYA